MGGRKIVGREEERVIVGREGVKEVWSHLECSGGATLTLLHLVLCFHMADHLSNASLHHHPSQAYLLQDVVNLVHVEDEVQLTNILKATIQCLHKNLAKGKESD